MLFYQLTASLPSKIDDSCAFFWAKGLFSGANCEFQGGYIYSIYINIYIYIHPYIAGQLIDQRFFMVIYQVAPAKTILHLKMYFLLNMGIFQCHVSFQVCNIFSSFHFKRIQVLSFWAKFHPSWSTDFSETTSSVLPLRKFIGKMVVHLGPGGPLIINPISRGYLLGSKSPFKKGIQQGAGLNS